VQWQVSTDGGSNWNDVSGASATTLTFTASLSQDGNKYRAVFSNSLGSTPSNAATLAVNTAPPPSLPVVAAVASSAIAVYDTGGTYPMLAFDGNAGTYWRIDPSNFGYADKWLQADLGAPKAVNQIVVDFGTAGTGGETIANDFALWVGNDPTFAPGTYQVAASITGNSSQVVTLPASPALNGRWVRYVVTRVTGSSTADYCIAEMRIYGTDLPSSDVKLTATSATASSWLDLPRTAPINAFDGR
jgi:hypothetical protein